MAAIGRIFHLERNWEGRKEGGNEGGDGRGGERASKRARVSLHARWEVGSQSGIE